MTEIQQLYDLTGRNALVTGATQGIGKAIAVGLADFGANVIVHGKDERQDAETVVSLIQSKGQKSRCILCDLEDKSAPQTLFEKATTLLGAVDILIINASLQIRKPWQHITQEDIDRQLTINFSSTLRLMQLFGGGMMERHWGRLLTIGSVQEKKPHPDMLVYAATKSANTNLVKNLAQQLAEYSITANNIAPGVVETPRNEAVLANPSYRSATLKKVPAGFLGTPYDIAGIVVSLCSEAGRYVTGQEIYVDGGMSL
ncbi:MAG: SDR family oxidoreductase [Tunicatimonas sp.]